MIEKKKGGIVWNLINFAILITVFSSCVTNRKTQYLQDAAEEDIPTYSISKIEDYKIQIGDQLYIKVIPFDMEVRKTFSMESTYASYSDVEAMMSLESFPVYDDGCIDYPLVGKIEVKDLTTRQARVKIEQLLIGNLYPDAQVTVKLVNNYVSLVGDVKKPGKYIIYKENLNIFQTLAMAGDISSFGDRTKIKIIRQTGQEAIIKVFDLRSDEIINSEFYFVQPNDVIFVGRIKGQFFGLDSLADFVALVSGSLAILSTSLLLWRS